MPNDLQTVTAQPRPQLRRLVRTMSFMLMKWAMRLQIRMAHAPARVLMVLADHADDDGGSCYPSLDTIAELAQMNRTTAVRSIASLRQLDIVRIEEGGRRGRAQSTRYRINLRAGQPQTKPGETPDLFPETVASRHTKQPVQNVKPTARKSGVTPHITAESVSFGDEKCGVTPHDSIKTPVHIKPESVRQPPPALRVVAGTSVAPPKPDPKGSRLPPDWRPTADVIQFARKLGLDPEAVLEEFRDYWAGVPGKAGRKSDWAGTFRNRCRAKAEQAVRTRPRRQTEQERYREMMRAEMGGDRTVDVEPERESLAALGWSG